MIWEQSIRIHHNFLIAISDIGLVLLILLLRDNSFGNTVDRKWMNLQSDGTTENQLGVKAMTVSQCGMALCMMTIVILIRKRVTSVNMSYSKILRGTA